MTARRPAPRCPECARLRPCPCDRADRAAEDEATAWALEHGVGKIPTRGTGRPRGGHDADEDRGGTEAHLADLVAQRGLPTSAEPSGALARLAAYHEEIGARLKIVRATNRLRNHERLRLEVQVRILELHRRGLLLEQIAVRMRVGRQTVSRHWGEIQGAIGTAWSLDQIATLCACGCGEPLVPSLRGGRARKWASTRCRKREGERARRARIRARRAAWRVQQERARARARAGGGLVRGRKRGQLACQSSRKRG